MNTGEYKEMAKKIVRGYKAGEIEADVSIEYDGHKASISEADGRYNVAIDDVDLVVNGDQRLRAVIDDSVQETEQPKKKAEPKEPKPERLEKICEVTGLPFETSKFTPNVTVSKAGRKVRDLANKHGVEIDAIMSVEFQLRDRAEHIAVYNKSTGEVELFTGSSSEASAMVVADLDNRVWIQQHI